MKKWYKYKKFWRRGDDDGDDTPQDRDDGTGDLLFNTLTKIVIDGDTSEWAIESFAMCGILLRDRMRWPDEFNKGDEAASWIAYKWNKLWKTGRYGYRAQGGMTRDPYVAYGACYSHLLGKNNGHYDGLLILSFGAVKIPLHLYSPKTWRWRRMLVKEDERKHYVKRLDYFRNLSKVNMFKLFDENNFYK